MSNFAPEYTKRERIVFVLKQMLWFLPLYAATELYFFDWLAEYSDNANCHFYGNITGVHLVMYGLFAGIPLFVAIIMAIFEGRRSIKIIKLGQNPLPGEKVFKKTEYKYGVKAKIQPIAIFCFISFFFVFSIWGSVQAYKITQDIKPCKQQLTSQSSNATSWLDALTRTAV